MDCDTSLSPSKRGIEGCMEVSTLPYSLRRFGKAIDKSLSQSLLSEETHFLPKWASLTIPVMFSHWLGIIYGTCELAQMWQWISEYSSWYTLSVTALGAGFLCGAFFVVFNPPLWIFFPLIYFIFFREGRRGRGSGAGG